MKITLASLLGLNLLGLPDGAVSFTASRPLAATRTITTITAPRQPTELLVKLPGFLQRNKEASAEDEIDVPAVAAEESISPEMTELAIETNTEEAEEEELSETKKMLKKVKEAGTAGGKFPPYCEEHCATISLEFCELMLK